MPITQEDHLHETTREWQSADYFKNIVSFLKNKEIKSFVDLGANVGGVTDILLEQIPSIERGYLFEPQKDNFKFLFNRYKDNSKISCVNCGIFYGKRYENFYRCDDNVGGYTVHFQEGIFQKTEEQCQLFELEFFNLGKVDFLKIDVEGAEFNIIENSKFMKDVEFLDIEVHTGDIEGCVPFFLEHLKDHSVILKAHSHFFLQRNV
jgi:FkbM family methyltransferase